MRRPRHIRETLKFSCLHAIATILGGTPTSLQHTSFNAEGVPTTEAILDRPTRGLPLIPYELKSSWGLCGEALKDTGECVPRQMAMLCGLTWDECCELLDSAYDQLTPAQRKGLQGRPWREVGVPPRMVAIACK